MLVFSSSRLRLVAISIVLILSAALAVGCTSKFQRSPLPSDDNRLIFKLVKRDQQDRDHPQYWMPSIASSSGKLLWSDRAGFPGSWTLFWAWDDADRVWIYVQDEDHVVRVHKRAKADGAYSMGIWSGATPCTPSAETPCPPAGIFPAAVRAKWLKSKP